MECGRFLVLSITQYPFLLPCIETYMYVLTTTPDWTKFLQGPGGLAGGLPNLSGGAQISAQDQEKVLI